MTAFRSMGAALESDNTTGTVPADVRHALLGMFTRAGVLPGSASPLVEGSASGFQYVVHNGTWLTSRGASDGGHLWGNYGDVTLTTGDDSVAIAAPSSGLQRIDIIYALHPSNGENADTTSAPVIAVRRGTAASSPIAPALPAGALELARNTMTSAATSTASSGNTIVQTSAVARPAGSSGAIGRVAVSTALVAADAALTSVITVPSLPWPYMVTVQASGQSGNAASSRNVAWGFDSISASATSSDSDNPVGSYTRVPVAGSQYATVAANAVIVMPANVDCTFRLVYRGDNNGYNHGSLVWRREHL